MRTVALVGEVVEPAVYSGTEDEMDKNKIRKRIFDGITSVSDLRSQSFSFLRGPFLNIFSLH
jgi:hypothetical protein